MEIIGEHLEVVLEKEAIDGVCTYRGDDFCIYELSEESFQQLEDIPEDEFDDCYPEVWYRFVEGATGLGAPIGRAIVNDRLLFGFPDKNGNTEFDCLTDYMIRSVGVGMSETNVAAVSAELAKINGISQAELWRTFEG